MGLSRALKKPLDPILVQRLTTEANHSKMPTCAFLSGMSSLKTQNVTDVIHYGSDTNNIGNLLEPLADLFLEQKLIVKATIT